MHIVDDKLIRGRAVTSPLRLYTMKKNNINQIIDLRNTHSIKKTIEKLTCKMLGIKYINLKYSHRSKRLPNQEFFEKINETILNNNGKTYIHCRYGKRRTGVSVAIYELKHSNKSKKEIIQNIFDLGFPELKNPQEQTSKRMKRYQLIIKELFEKYFI